MSSSKLKSKLRKEETVGNKQLKSKNSKYVKQQSTPSKRIEEEQKRRSHKGKGGRENQNIISADGKVRSSGGIPNLMNRYKLLEKTQMQTQEDDQSDFEEDHEEENENSDEEDNMPQEEINEDGNEEEEDTDESTDEEEQEEEEEEQEEEDEEQIIVQKKKNMEKKKTEQERNLSMKGEEENNNNDEQEQKDDDNTSGKNKMEVIGFDSLGICSTLVEACNTIGWKTPTEIQQNSLPPALEGRDIIGLAETGSGKTGAFALPILQSLLAGPQRQFAVVLAPTRELAFQINEVFEALGASIGLKTCCVVGGIDMMTQAIALARKPHIIIGTPGRLVDHLENTKGFNLRTVKYLVLDEADRMLSMDFEEEITKILTQLPSGKERNTFLFSATMTSKVAKLQRASLTNPVKVEISHKFSTPKTLVQQYLFIPAKYKDCYLAYTMNEFQGQSTLIFVATCTTAQRLAIFLRTLGFGAICLHGQMSQPKRIGALNKFKAGNRPIMVATDVASRGLDIPSVDLVINYDIPSHGKDYIHRVGRTARAGRAGRSIAMVTQYDVEVYQRLEALIGQKLPEYACDEETVLILLQRVAEASRIATREVKEMNVGGKKGKRNRREDDLYLDEDENDDGQVSSQQLSTAKKLSLMTDATNQGARGLHKENKVKNYNSKKKQYKHRK